MLDKRKSALAPPIDAEIPAIVRDSHVDASRAEGRF
jgi:hypothetical protein